MKRACWLAWRGWNRCRRIDIQFASAVDGRIAKEMQARVGGRPEPAKTAPGRQGSEPQS